MGTAIRLTQSLGLNVDPAPLVRSGQLTPKDAEARIKTFWTVYAQDLGWSVWQGLATSFPASDFTTPLIRPDSTVDASPFVPGSDNIGLSIPSHLSTSFAATCTLLLLSSRILKTNFGLRSNLTPQGRRELVAELAVQLESWYQKLPSPLVIGSSAHRGEVPPVVIALELAYQWTLILLYRPSAREAGAEDNEIAIKRLDRAATRIVRSRTRQH